MQQDTNQTKLLRGLGEECLLIHEVATTLDLTHDQISRAAALLILRGLVERVDRGCYQLTAAGRAGRDGGVMIASGVNKTPRALRKPHRVSIRQRAWNAMRIARTFTVLDITTAVARADDGDVQQNLRHYFNELGKHGYLARSVRRRQGSAPGSTGFAIWSLIRDTGPVAPVWSRKSSAVHDFNGEASCIRS